MKRISNYFMQFLVMLTFSATIVGCSDDYKVNDDPFIFQPINIEYSLDNDKMSETYNMVTYKWEDRTESPATHYIVTTYQGLKEEGGKAIATTKKVAHDDSSKTYTVFVDEKLLSGTTYEVEVTPYMGNAVGNIATLSFESEIDDVVGANTKVATTASSATFNWMPIGEGVPRKIKLTPTVLNVNATEEAVVVEQDIPEGATSVTVEGLVAFTGYTAELLDKLGGIVGRYSLTTSMSGGIIVFTSEELKTTIESLSESGGAIQLSTAKGTTEFEYSGDFPASVNAFYLMGSVDFENPDSIATLKLSANYVEGSGQAYIMRLNIDGKNELSNFITLKAADDPSALTQGAPANGEGIFIQDCQIANYTGAFLYSPVGAYQQLAEVSVTNTTIANMTGGLVEFRVDENPSFSNESGDDKYYGSTVKEMTFDGVTVYNVANVGSEVVGTRGTPLFKLGYASSNNKTKGSYLNIFNSTIISSAPQAEIFQVEDYNYQGKTYPGGIFVKDCLFADISIESMSTRTGQTKDGNNFNPTTNEAADAESMMRRTPEAQEYGANSNTANYPLCGVSTSVTFADTANLDFTITGGTATKGNPALYKQ